MAKKITGVKTPTEQTAEIAKRSARPRGGKPGSAVGAQSAQYADGELTGDAPAAPEAAIKGPRKSDTISSVKNATSGGDYTAIAAPGHKTLLLKGAEWMAVAKLAVVGGSYAAVEAALAAHKAAKPAAKLANGVDAQNSPHAAKAVADAKRKATAPAPAKPAPAKPAPAKPAKAEKTPAAPAAKGKLNAPVKLAPPTGGVDRKYKATKKEDASKPDTFRNYMISTIRAHGATNAAKAAHAASGKFSHERLNFKWAHDNGYIVIADLA